MAQCIKLCLLTLCLLPNAPSAKAQELDLSSEFTKRLYAQTGRIALPGGTLEWCTPSGVGVVGMKPGDIGNNLRCLIRFKNVKVAQVPGSVVKKPIAFSPVDNSVEGNAYIRDNCTPKAYPIDTTVQVKFTEGETISRTETITEGDNLTLTDKESVSLFGIGFDSSQTQNISFLQQTIDAETHSEGKERTESEHITGINVDPMTSRYINITEKIRKGYEDFAGDIVVNDADVTVQFVPKVQVNNVPPTAELPLGKLSDLLPDERTRTFHLEGRLWNAKGVRAERIDIQTALDAQSPACQIPQSKQSPKAR